MLRLATLALLFTCAARAEDGEARFKPRTYVPSTPAKSQSYQATPYASSKAASAAAPASGKSAEPSRPGFWSFFRAKPLEESSKLDSASPLEAKPYAQRQQITASTMTPDRKAINMDEHKPYVEGESKLQAAGYKPPEKPREKNPLLAPRQGIKEPQP